MRADRAIGCLVEQQYRSKAHAHFQRIARRLHVLTPEELDALLDAAITAREQGVWLGTDGHVEDPAAA